MYPTVDLQRLYAGPAACFWQIQDIQDALSQPLLLSLGRRTVDVIGRKVTLTWAGFIARFLQTP